MLLADTVTNVIDPTASWIGVFLQGGAFLLVCFIVVVLYPKEAEKARVERKERDEALERIINTQHKNFEERNKEVVEAVERQTTIISQTFLNSATKIESAVANACKAHLRN